ncbi:MAG TPA: GIY-YIG nuclease family protein, partial [Saprospiraceae bacterium]|nr:GIY-YIG nuclease family protein [Saprospiraceae bacterium]
MPPAKGRSRRSPLFLIQFVYFRPPLPLLHRHLHMTNEEFKAFSPTIPTSPGIYKYIDAQGVILYVGKAKNLRNRLSSYFGDKKHQLAKTKVLVRHAHHIEFTIVETEHDALLLENTLIKKHQPRYNVMLKDEKSPLVY